MTTHKLWNDVKNYNDLAHFETAWGEPKQKNQGIDRCGIVEYVSKLMGHPYYKYL